MLDKLLLLWGVVLLISFDSGQSERSNSPKEDMIPVESELNSDSLSVVESIDDFYDEYLNGIYSMDQLSDSARLDAMHHRSTADFNSLVGSSDWSRNWERSIRWYADSSIVHVSFMSNDELQSIVRLLVDRTNDSFVIKKIFSGRTPYRHVLNRRGLLYESIISIDWMDCDSDLMEYSWYHIYYDDLEKVVMDQGLVEYMDFNASGDTAVYSPNQVVFSTDKSTYVDGIANRIVKVVAPNGDEFTDDLCTKIAEIQADQGSSYWQIDSVLAEKWELTFVFLP